MQIQDRPQEDVPGIAEAAHSAVVEENKLASHGLYRMGLAYGRQVYRFRWIIIALWAIGLAISIPFAGKLPSILTGGGYSFKDSESTHVNNLITDTLHQPPSQMFVVFQSSNTQVSDPTYQQEVNDFINRAKSFQNVSGVYPGGVGQDGRTTFVLVNFNKTADVVEKQVDQFQKLLPASGSGPAKAYLTGNPAIYQEFTTISETDTRYAEIVALPIALLVLLVVFGTFVAATMPLLLALVAVPVALAIIYPIALHNETSIFVLSVSSIIGLGISIDYSLFMTRRFREELALGRSVSEAVSWTVATAGEAILFSGLTVMIGFTGLLLIGIQFMTSFGIGGAIVVGVSVLAALTLLPSLLGMFGTRVNALRVPFIWRVTAPHLDTKGKERQGFWQKLALGVMRRPVMIVLLVTAFLVALGWPIFSINIGTPTSSALPTSAQSRQGLDILNAQFPETNSNPVYIVVQSPDGSSMLTAANLAHLSHLTQWIAAQPHVTSVSSLTKLPATPGSPALSADQLTALYTSGAYQQNPAMAQYVASTTSGNTTVITVKTDAKVDSSDGKALIDNLRAGDKAAGQGLAVYVGGFQAISLDFNRYLYGNFPKAILFVLIATYVLLFLMFRSVLLPLKAIIMNVLSVSATYGVLVFIFQWGNLSQFLNFTANGYIDSTAPILLFCILFGLSMDYEVFLLSRIREEWLNTRDNRYSVARGLEETGGVITSAALLFVIVTVAFAFTTLVSTKEMGLGMTIAVLVDATVIRSLLVPATMRLLGKWNWWLPGRPHAS